jgi:hypothetical protein
LPAKKQNWIASACDIAVLIAAFITQGSGTESDRLFYIVLFFQFKFISLMTFKKMIASDSVLP